MRDSAIINELLEAIVSQELAMANLIDAEGKLIKACSNYSLFQEHQIGMKIELDQNINMIFHALSDHEMCTYQKLKLIQELRHSNLFISQPSVEIEVEAEDAVENEIFDLDELYIENLLDNLDNELELIDDEEDENDKPNE